MADGQQQQGGPTTSAADQAHAASLRSRDAGEGASASDLDGFPSVAIDAGRQKYVLIRVTHPTTSDDVFLVRGDCASAYHADAAQATTAALERAGLAYEVTGGGRIEHDPSKNTLSIFGHSYGFGLADHSISAGVCAAFFGGSYQIETSNEGY